MSLRNENFHKRANTLYQVQQTLNETFKPIVTPLRKIIGGLQNIKKFDLVKEEVKNLDQENIDDLSFKSADYEGEDSTYLESSSADMLIENSILHYKGRNRAIA